MLFPCAGLQFEHDRRKDAELLAAGYRVMRVTWRELTERPEAVLVRLTRALSPAAAPSSAPAGAAA